MPTELQLIQGTILSLKKTVEFHKARGPIGLEAMSAAGRHLAGAEERLVVEVARRKAARAAEMAP